MAKSWIKIFCCLISPCGVLAYNKKNSFQSLLLPTRKLMRNEGRWHSRQHYSSQTVAEAKCKKCKIRCGKCKKIIAMRFFSIQVCCQHGADSNPYKGSNIAQPDQYYKKILAQIISTIQCYVAGSQRILVPSNSE